MQDLRDGVVYFGGSYYFTWNGNSVVIIHQELSMTAFAHEDASSMLCYMPYAFFGVPNCVWQR